jgi:hypothetical protein
VTTDGVALVGNRCFECGDVGGQVFEEIFRHFVRDELRFQRQCVRGEGARGVQEQTVIVFRRQTKFVLQTHDARGAIDSLQVYAQLAACVAAIDSMLARLADAARLGCRLCLYLHNCAGKRGSGLLGHAVRRKLIGDLCEVITRSDKRRVPAILVVVHYGKPPFEKRTGRKVFTSRSWKIVR